MNQPPERVLLTALSAEWTGVSAQIVRVYPPGFSAVLRARVRRWEGVLDRWRVSAGRLPPRG